MNNKISNWNGYPVHGDTKELDSIVESDGLINLDKADIVSVLSAEGESHVTTGVNVNLGEAFKEAINSLPCSIDKVSNLLIDFRCGTRQPDMAELTTATGSLSEANTDIEITWGMSSDSSLGETCKVVLVASVKA